MEATRIETFFRSLLKEGLYQGFIELNGREYHFSPTLGFEERTSEPSAEKKPETRGKKVTSKKQPLDLQKPGIPSPEQGKPTVDPLADRGAGMPFQEGQKVRVSADGSVQVVNPGRSGWELSELEKGVKGRKTYLFIAMSVLVVIIILALILLTIS